MNIPLPEMGHWNKVAAGKKVAVKALQKESPDENQIKLTLRVEGGGGDRSSQSVLQQQTEADFGADLVIQSALNEPDNLVLKAQKELLQKSKRYKDVELVYAGTGNLDIRVSIALKKRSPIFLSGTRFANMGLRKKLQLLSEK
ncbi:hypothetical protein U0035_04345 [Niabella yanshanensis]|uniref:Uncharacterized protein n=1 Tax=Niabella yanshanensis TaxID=577386 RepID=A0ABZ0WA35_9BACT|nr:hypothetical protein [Niabella yanshanensis]WQD39374.1 hypothetical protein U0035_04345 [Niabella yanshanensis]